MCCARLSMVMPRCRGHQNRLGGLPGVDVATNNRSSPWSTPVLPRSAQVDKSPTPVSFTGSLIDTTVEDSIGSSRSISAAPGRAPQSMRHRGMIERGGEPLPTCRRRGQVGSTGAYGMSKAGHPALSRTAALMRSSGIRPTRCCPHSSTPRCSRPPWQCSTGPWARGVRADDCPAAGPHGRTERWPASWRSCANRRCVDDHRHHPDRRRQRCRAVVIPRSGGAKDHARHCLRHATYVDSVYSGLLRIAFDHNELGREPSCSLSHGAVRSVRQNSGSDSR